MHFARALRAAGLPVGPGRVLEALRAVEADAVLTYSAREQLQEKDFEQMSADELAQARRELARLRLPIMDVATRRHDPSPRGARVDLRRTLRWSLRGGGDSIDLARRKV